MNSCPKCHVELKEGQTFCESCGTALKEGVKPKESFSATVEQAKTKQKKQIRQARIAILIVAILNIAVAIFYWYQLGSELVKIAAQPGMIIDDKAVMINRALILSTLIIGFIYLGLFFWAKKNPFGASLTALIIYLTIQIVSAIISPETIHQGILLKVIIIAALASGVQNGLAHRKLVSQAGP